MTGLAGTETSCYSNNDDRLTAHIAPAHRSLNCIHRWHPYVSL